MIIEFFKNLFKGTTKDVATNVFGILLCIFTAGMYYFNQLPAEGNVDLLALVFTIVNAINLYITGKDGSLKPKG